MTIRLIEGFDFYRGDIADARKKFAITTSGAGDLDWANRFQSPGRWGGYSFRAETEGYVFRTKSLGNENIVTCGIAVKFNTPADVCRILSVQNSIGQDNCILHLRRSGVTEEGYLEVSNGTTIIGSSNLKLEPDVWHYIEMRVFPHPTSGTVTVRVGEQNTILLFGVNTAGSGTQGVGFVEFETLSNAGSGDYVEIDDFYVVDGTAPANTFLGDVVVEAQYPIDDSNIASDAQWNIVGGEGDGGYQAVDDLANVDEDTSYISNNNINQRHLFEMTDLEILTGAIEAVSIEVIARLDGANPGDTRVMRGAARYVPNSTVFATNNTMTLDDSNLYDWVGAIYPTNGATGQPWTRQDVHLTLFGIEVVT